MAVSRTHFNHRLCSCGLSRIFALEWLARGQPSVTERRPAWHTASADDVFNKLRATLYSLARLPANAWTPSTMATQPKDLSSGFCPNHDTWKSRRGAARSTLKATRGTTVTQPCRFF